MEHEYVIGKTGMGKSTFLSNFFFDELRNNRPIVFLDPHGENVHALADALPRSLIKRTVLLDASDYHYPVGFDPLANPLHAFTGLKSLHEKSWGPQVEYLLRYAFLAVADYGGTLNDIVPLFTTTHVRERIIETIKDPFVRKFWSDTFPREYAASRKEPYLPAINKIDVVNTSPVNRFLCQHSPKLDFKELLREKHILLVNLAKPQIGEEASSLLGAMITATLRAALLEEPHPCTLIADEFQTYGTSLYVSMLSEMRKFGLKIVLCHQFISQIDEQLRDAILGNTTRQIIFNVGYTDAVVLAKSYNRLTQDFNPAAITELERFEAFVNGRKQTLPDFTPPYGTGKYAAVQTYSRLHYAQLSASRLAA